jgi:hypothetical protein
MSLMLTPLLLLASAPAATPPHAAPAPSQTRGLSCAADDASVREIVIDFAAGRWREAGGPWSRIVAQDDATITLARQGGTMLSDLFSDLRRVEQLDRATLTLSTQLHSGLIDEKRTYRCRIVAPFDAERQI